MKDMSDSATTHQDKIATKNSGISDTLRPISTAKEVFQSPLENTKSTLSDLNPNHRFEESSSLLPRAECLVEKDSAGPSKSIANPTG